MTSNTAVLLSQAMARVVSCQVAPEEARFVEELAVALAACERAFSREAREPREAEYARSQRVQGARLLLDVLHGVLLARLDRWLRSEAGRAAVARVTGPSRSRNDLRRYAAQLDKPRAEQDAGAIPSLLSITHWVLHTSRLEPEPVARELLAGLSLRDDAMLLSQLMTAGHVRNVLSHLPDYEKPENPASLPPELASWLYRSERRVQLDEGLFPLLATLALQLLNARASLEPERAYAAPPAARAATPTPPVGPELGPSAPPPAPLPATREQPLAPPYRAPASAPTKPSRGGLRSWVLVGASVATLGLLAAGVLVARGGCAPSPPPVVVETARMREFLARWGAVAWQPSASPEQLAEVYAPRVTVMPLERTRALHRAELPTQWSRARADRVQPTWENLSTPTLSREERPYAQWSDTVRRACPDGTLYRVALRASAAVYNCGEQVRVPAHDEEYLVRVAVDASGALRVCYEAWSSDADHRLCDARRGRP